MGTAAYSKEIAGVVRWGAPEPGETEGIGSLSAVAGIDVSVTTTDGTALATAVTDENGEYVLQFDSGESAAYTDFILEAATTGARLRAVADGPHVDIDPVSEVIVEQVIKSGSPTNSFTADEIRLINKELATLAANVDFQGVETPSAAVALLLNDKNFSLSLGDLINTYSTEGDTVVEVNDLKSMITKFIAAFTNNDPSGVADYITNDVQIIVGDKVYDYNGIQKFIEEINRKFEMNKFDVECARVRVDGDSAEVETSEKLLLTSRAGGEVTSDSWNMINTVRRIGGKWRLVDRKRKKCVVAKRSITPDGDISDWVGIRPCLIQKPVVKGGSGVWGRIESLYFARDEMYLYWRMDLPRTAAASNGEKTSRGLYSLTLKNDTGDEGCDHFINMIVYEGVQGASLGESCIRGADNTKKEATYTYEKYGVGKLTVEGRVPLDDIGYLPNGVIAFGAYKGKTHTGEKEKPTVYTDDTQIFFTPE